ncbi:MULTISPECIES: helix-turn-helix domain-containing protein [Streptomyces]|uniref:Transcriptional regulator n=1 Tax=Streptomyces canarius TaxID=285453 RepID=A0ABQ3DES8_9ACTN|nr:helix-turn-helix transcriptional regulator [Streptomyces canarius]GHA65624.1 transcriptional regulator [Streptomyces canarius]
MKERNELGQYLKARRARITPAQAGLIEGTGYRRVPGLRREEVAALAGLSADYYARLEQGRERHPSTSVLKALARVLQLNPDAQRYLFALASPDAAGRLARPAGREVGPNLLALLDDWSAHPAIVTDHCMNVVAANALGAALYVGHPHADNLARLLFIDDTSHTFFRDWETVAASTVAALRAAASHRLGDTELRSLVGELTVHSKEFTRHWQQAEVHEKTSGTLLLRHPQVGDLDLTYETLRPSASPDLLVKIYRPQPESSTRDRLAILGSLTASPRPGHRSSGSGRPLSGTEERAAEPPSGG